MCLSVTLHIVNLWRYCVCCTRSGVIRCTLFMALYLAVCAGVCYMRCCDRTWYNTYESLRCRTSPRSTAGLLFPSQYLCGTILMTPYSIEWDWGVSRAGPMPFYWPNCSLPFCLSPILSFCLGWYRGAEGSSD